MVYKMTKKIYDWLQENKPSLKVFIDEREKSSNVWLQFGIKNGGSYRIRFISSARRYSKNIENNKTKLQQLRKRIQKIIYRGLDNIIRILQRIN